MKSYLCLILYFAILSLSHTQMLHPQDGILFEDELVSRIDISISSDDLEQILDPSNASLNIEYPATFIFTQGDIQDTVDQVGFRLRGNTSRQSSKPSLKVSFNTFQPGQKYRGIEKLNLNGEHNDPTIARSKIAWDLMKSQDIPASRTSHVQLYINGNYRGLYLNVEHIDEEFINKRFKDGSGNLYKCLWPADLTYINDNPDVYKVNHGNRRVYDLKTNTDKDDYSDLAHLIDVINNTPTNDLPCELESIFDIQSYLRLVAADVFIGNWDGHLFNKNNFYLYHDPCTEKFVMIPYDLDNTYGIDWFGVDWSTRSLDYWVDNLSGNRPLIEKLINIPKYRNNIEAYLVSLMQTWQEKNYQEDFYALRDMLSDYREDDPFAGLDYGYSLNDFRSNYTHGLSDHATQGLVEYLDSRLSFLSQQLDLEGHSVPALQEYTVDISETNIDFSLRVNFMEDNQQVALHLMQNDGSWHTTDFSLFQENHYNVSIPRPIDSDQFISWYITLDYGIAGVSRYPTCDHIETRILAGPFPKIVINEVVTDNSNGLQDEAGEFPDWIELYNAGDTIVNLGGYFLTDKRDNLQKWRLPSIDIAPDGYLIFYADSDGHQGPLHTNFKLNKDGEFLALVGDKSHLNVIVDSLTIPPLDDDHSYGRLPNGFGEFTTLPHSSPQWNNEQLSSTTPTHNGSKFELYPNPFRKSATINSSLAGSLDIYASDGRLLFSTNIQSGSTSLDLRELPFGVLIATITTSDHVRHSERFVKY